MGAGAAADAAGAARSCFFLAGWADLSACVSTALSAGGGGAVRRRDEAGLASTGLTSETAIVSGSVAAAEVSAARRRRREAPSAGGAFGAGAGGSGAAAPRRRRAGAAAGAVARARFSRSHRALIRATWSSESGVMWLRTGMSICRRRLITSSMGMPNSPAMSLTRNLLKRTTSLNPGGSMAEPSVLNLRPRPREKERRLFRAPVLRQSHQLLQRSRVQPHCQAHFRSAYRSL